MPRGHEGRQACKGGQESLESYTPLPSTRRHPTPTPGETEARGPRLETSRELQLSQKKDQTCWPGAGEPGLERAHEGSEIPAPLGVAVRFIVLTSQTQTGEDPRPRPAAAGA